MVHFNSIFTHFYPICTKFSSNFSYIKLNLANEQDPLVLPSVVLYKRLTEEMGARYIWVPGVNITDGIVCDYAERNHMIRFSHDFEKDILAASRNLAERYQSYSSHTEAVLSMSTTIFDAMKKVHGMGKRERLLLQVASILHDCGRYMSLVNQSECSYHIIMASEIIGMSHLEREIVATIAKHDALSMQPYDSVIGKMNRESYMVVSKLTAILKIANAMDRSHKQKFKNIKAVLKGRELIITVEAEESIVLEKGLFSTYADSFKEATRTIKNSSKLEEVILTNFNLSNKGMVLSLASFKTRWSNLSQLNSRFS